MSDFDRLTSDLRFTKIDFDYRKTRKLLDPQWDGYTMTKGADVEIDYATPEEANLVTSQHRSDPNMHRVVLDLDYGANVLTLNGITRMRLGIHNIFIAGTIGIKVADDLQYFGIAKEGTTPVAHLLNDGKAMLEVDIDHDYALVPSSTEGHHHLILDLDMPWNKYKFFLERMWLVGLIEKGFAKASVSRGFSSVRPPWIRK